MAQLKLKSGHIEKFLGPGDTFSFNCNRCTRCCHDRENNPILLTPYDSYRLATRCQVKPSEWVDLYAKRILGGESQLPFLLLNFVRTEDGANKCPFVTEAGCSVYEDRPTVCRLYPLGRLVDREQNSYFFKVKTAPYCSPGREKQHTLEDWLTETEVEPFLDWNDRFTKLFLEMDCEKYRSCPASLKATLGRSLYEFDLIEDQVYDDEFIQECLAGPDGQLQASFVMAQRLIEKWFQ